KASTKDVSDKLTALNEAKDALRTAIANTPAAAKFPAFADALANWAKVQDKVVVIAADAGDIKAREMSTGPGLAATNEVMAAIDESLALVRQQMADSRNDAENQYQAGITLLVGVLLAALIVGVAAAMWISISISRGLTQAISAAQALASGDLTRDIEVKGN